MDWEGANDDDDDDDHNDSNDDNCKRYKQQLLSRRGTVLSTLHAQEREDRKIRGSRGEERGGKQAPCPGV